QRGVWIDGASPTLTANTIRGAQIGIRVTGASAPQIVGANTVTGNNIGVSIEGTGAGGGNPRPALSGNNLFENRVGAAAQRTNVQLLKFFLADLTAPFDLTGNYWGTTDPAAIQASIVSRTPATPVPVDISGFASGPLSALE